MSTLTVTIPTYNVGKYIAEALDSILHSTVQLFEVLLCDDGSTDNTCEIIEKYRQQHSNITLIKNEINRGVGYTRARMMRLVTTEFVALCDADDINHPDRFKKQLAYLNAHPDVSVVGSLIQAFYGDDRHNTGHVWQCLEHDADIKATLLHTCELHANTMMMRMPAIKHTGVEFNPTLRIGEDHDYWVSIAPFVKFANIQEVLVFYRRHNTQLTNENDNLSSRISCHIQSCQKMLAHYGIKMGPEAINAFCFPHSISPLRVGRRTKQELTSFVQNVIDKNCAPIVPLWSMRALSIRLCPYARTLPAIRAVLTVYRIYKRKTASFDNIARFYVLALLMPFFVPRTIRALAWFLMYRLGLKPL